MVSLHSDRMFALYQSSIPSDIIEMIDITIKENAVNVIANYWRGKIQKLTDTYVEYYKQTRYYPITQQDINLIYTLKRTMKNKCITLDYTFWHGVLERMYQGFYISKTVIIGDTTFNRDNDADVIVYYGNLLFDLLVLTAEKSRTI